ncbi:rCG28905 [Rattus norvegicus]|uniref:RCG28905 n=1 Tax=Rattus norvegicus TaxID=10116 RepID=A6HUT4_RAT|nr:rCG28905 [Rattus norvegicus]
MCGKWVILPTSSLEGQNLPDCSRHPNRIIWRETSSRLQS